MTKPTRLKYTGTIREFKDDAGNVISRKASAWFDGVPTRDLDEADIAELDADTLEKITGGPEPLYVDPDAGKPAKTATRKRSPKTKKAAPKAPQEPAGEPEAPKPEETESEAPNEDEPSVEEGASNA